MENIFGEYLKNPDQVQIALNFLDEKCLELSVQELFGDFENTIGLQSGDRFPITPVVLGGLFCRARLNTLDFEVATSVSQIGAKPYNALQGRANPDNMCVFYAANNKSTAAMEVLQGQCPGLYDVTIGCWESDQGLRVANLIDGSDPDFTNLSFAHSMPKDYVKDWPELPQKSVLLILDYFKNKFKMLPVPGLYNITNVIAGICYSLQDIDGIGYAAISNNFSGFNLAISKPEKLECVEVERWRILKVNDYDLQYKLLEKGSIDTNGVIKWS
jgi:hypothetical protein